MATMSEIRAKLQAKETAKATRQKAWDDHREAKGALGEALAARWLRDDRGMEIVEIDQTKGTKADICPPDGKRPDFLLDFEDNLFADAKLHLTEGLTRFRISVAELARYRAFLNAYGTQHLVFLLIPDEDHSELIVIHIDQMTEHCSLKGNPALGITLTQVDARDRYPLPADWDSAERDRLVAEGRFVTADFTAPANPIP